MPEQLDAALVADLPPSAFAARLTLPATATAAALLEGCGVVGQFRQAARVDHAANQLATAMKAFYDATVELGVITR